MNVGPTAPVPPPGREDDVFQKALTDRGLILGATRDEARHYALVVCNQISDGVDIGDVLHDVHVGTGFSPADVGYIVGAAAAAYRPDLVPLLSAP